MEEGHPGETVFSWSLDDTMNEEPNNHQGNHLWKKEAAHQGHNHGFEQMVFSWSLEDILNESKVEDIPLTFESEERYFSSFRYPLLEETRAELASAMEIMYRAPYAEIYSIRVTGGIGEMLYDVTVGNWRNKTSERGKEPYRTLPGDILILADGKPESVSDLQREGRTWVFSLVYSISDDGDEDGVDSTSTHFKVQASQQIEFQEGMFVVFLINTTTNKRIWNSLHMHRNMNIIKEVLYSDSMIKECCNICSFDSDLSQKFDPHFLDKLNESQAGAIRAALCKTECCHGSFVEQIWGPPGTGKTSTVSVLLFILLQMNRRTLTCAPTNVAIVQVASRVLNLVKGSFSTTLASGDYFHCIGDILLFGNKQRLKVGTEIEEIFLENRVKRLTECLGSLTGWKHCIRSMVDLLENCVSQYHVFVENELFKEEQLTTENQNETKATKLEVKSFIEFVRDRFSSCVSPLRSCILTFLTHIPKGFMKEHNFQKMVSLLDDLSVFNSLLFEESLVSEELEQLLTSKPLQTDLDKLGDMSSINFFRTKSLSVLKALLISLEGLGLPNVLNKFAINDFCFQNASLIFCTTSTSYKLHRVEMKPLEVLVIDEAAQLKEAESVIPLQLSWIKHAILIGDECQLPAMISSSACRKSGFGRSLFGRLSSLGHSKHLLNVQYRMHPSISLFPNYKFYQNQILDAENITCKSYDNKYLSGPMFGPYSFINVVGGREEKDEDERSWRNMVEVALVIKIVQNLYKAWQASRKKLTIGVVSPYAAQVVSIQEKLANKYEKLDGFSVTVKSVDGFQGGEEDVIILSTVRSNRHGSVGFLSSPQRTNVALTRARHCLWILGNERTLTSSECEWNELVCDARNRHCLFDADTDDSLKRSIIATKKELDQLDDLVNGNSVLFKHEKWKVLFSDDFRRSFGKLTSASLKKLVLNLLLRLSAGWRPKNRSVEVCCESSSLILKKFKVEDLYVICSVDIIKEVKYIQVLKVWDILPLEEIFKLTKRIESIFTAYTDAYINLCSAKCIEGNLEVPRSWPASQEIIRFRSLSNGVGDSDAGMNHGDGRIYVENSKVSESLLLMKFYSLSRGVVSHLLSGKELDLPMQVTDEQMDIILFCKTSFIIGRSGTGKTTILTMKLFQNEHNFQVASEGINEVESSRISEVLDDSESSKPSVLRQLFVTVSPKLCYAVKQHVSHLTSISCHGNSSAEINLDDADFTSEFNDIADTFVEIPVKKYPLVITFHKFLMMLDGTLESSYFERFLEARESSVALQNFIRSKEVTFDRFCLNYWPHFNSNHKKKLDPSRVFTEIISHIKGGLQAGECNDGKLSFEGYSSLAESRVSTLTQQKRENVYYLFQAYENMKTERREFDLGDLVIDLHHRLKNGRYKGDQMDFIYIDEVQDLSMRQISLFKYICQNVDEGFIFAGDTAQTIARGIDFRFQDIRSLFYKEFITSKTAGKQEKGLINGIFQLKQNFRTHAGVLDLAQSVIDLLYCYFKHSIDILAPETSLISGEAPVLLESGNDENAIVTIFGGSRSGAEIVGFGAEQVILVRDDDAKTEICEYIEKQALVLTILECKGLEFQDVLLFNFFGTSPLKDQWRVIYEYMKDHDWLDEKLPQSFPSFNESRHSVLCSELKQLYVAITRTRQRLWICENKEELSKPMFDYWKRRGLVQVRKLDDSVAQAMRVASSPQEWRERGKKLFYESNFVMATMCFERAGDKMWETLAKASSLRASGEQMRGTNPEAFSGSVREAGEMFESIGKHESAASCYYDLEEYERAGKIYLYKCGKTDAAAECFTKAGCYSDAAEAYAKGDKFSNCLSVCKNGKLFYEGLQYIEQWKERVNVRSTEMEQIKQEFLESCALDYHEHKDPNSMMKFVRAFCSMESKRVFLRSLGCLDDLMILEEESGHFLNAAELARSWGDVLKEADLLEKAGHSKEATVLLLWYVFFSSLWGIGNKGWPLKQFAQKEELCERAKSLAKTHSESFYEFVCSELKLLSDQHSSLLELGKDLNVSCDNKSLRGGIILIRKILDSHTCLNSSMYGWEDKLSVDMNEHCEDMSSRNQATVRTLVFYWDSWKEHVLDIFESLENFDKKEPNEHEGHVDFVLNYFGVRKQCVQGKTVYMLVNEHADWIRNAGRKGLHRDGKLLAIDIRDLVSFMKSYWQSELLSVGVKVLETLEGLHMSKSNGSVLHQSTSLLHIFKVYKFLLDCQYLNVKDKKKLQRFLGISMTYSDLVFPLDWQTSVSKDLISLWETDLSRNLLESAPVYYCNLKEYERAGKIYFKCGRMDEAAECFTKAGCYSDAAKAYAKGDKLSNCLSACKKGKLFDEGLQYIEQWKEHVNAQSTEMEQIEQEFLESCAKDCHKHKDPNSMMKFVRAFCSMESKRVFLRSLGCLDNLMILEEESGHFLNAVELARSCGDILKEADYLEKAGSSKEATVLLLWYAFLSSLWGNGNKGWPLTQFAQKEELCKQAKSLAKTHSDSFYKFVCGELKLLSDQHCSLVELKKDLHVSQKSKSIRGEIFFIRKILDLHIGLDDSKYYWEDELCVDIIKHCDDMAFCNQVSVRTLVFYWNAWKENVLDILESLESFHKEELNEHEGRVDFILNYFGVRKQCVKGNIIYILVNEHTGWIRNAGQKGLHRDGKLLSIDIGDLVLSMKSYWQSELLSVGIKVLETLNGLHKSKSKSNGSVFHQSTSLLYVFEVSKFLLDCKYVNQKGKVERFIKISSTYFDLVFPLDWRSSVSDDLLSLRETDLSLNLLEKIIHQNVGIKGDISYWAIGRVMMICFGSRKPSALYKHIITRIQWNPAWKSCFEIFMNGGFIDAYVAQALLHALEDTYTADWISARYISPHSFVYLLESLHFMTSFSSRIFFTTKSSFVGWFTHIHSTSTDLSPNQTFLDHATNFIVTMIQQILYDKTDTISWIRGSEINVSYYHPLLSLKLVMILSLICLKVPDCSPALLDLLLGIRNVAYLLPENFVSILLMRRNGRFLNLSPEVVAEAFRSIDDPLLIVGSENANPRIHAPGALFVDLRKSKEEIMRLLFPRKTVVCVKKPSNNDDTGKILEAPSSNTLPDENLNVNPLKLGWNVLEDISEAINGKEGVELNTLAAAVMIKEELDKNIGTLTTALADKKLCVGKDATVVQDMNLANDDLKLLSSVFGSSPKNVEHSVVLKSVERLQCFRSKVDDFLNHSATSQESKTEQMMVVSESSSTTVAEQTSEEKCHVTGTGDGSLAMDNQSGGVNSNTQDAENKKGKKKKSKKNKGTGDGLLAVDNQSSSVNSNTQDANNNKGNGKNAKNKGTGDGSLAVDNQSSGVNSNTQNANNNKGKGKKNKKKKGKNN